MATVAPVWLTSWMWLGPNENTVPLLYTTDGDGAAAEREPPFLERAVGDRDRAAAAVVIVEAGVLLA